MEKKTKRALIGVLCGIPIVAGGVAAIFLSKNCSPEVVTHTVNFLPKVGDEEGVTITPNHLSVKEGTKFGEIWNQADARKNVDDTEYGFKGWVDEVGSGISKDLIITTDLNVYADFKAPEVNKIVVRFTPDPKDPDGITINPSFVEIDKSDSFGNITSGVTAEKVTNGKKWDLQYWYRSDYNESWPIDPTITIDESITVHPYFTPPVSLKWNVSFDTGGQQGVFIKSEEGETTSDFSLNVLEGTKLSKVINDNKIEAWKTIDGVDYPAKYWTLDLTIDPDKEWVEPELFDQETEINANLVLYPYFGNPVETWREKQVAWEQYDDPEGTHDYDKTFELASDFTTFSTSHFILSGTGDHPIFMQDKEEIKATVTVAGETGVTVDAIVNQQTEDKSENLDVDFLVNGTVTPGQTYNFSVSFTNYFKGTEQITSKVTIDGFSFVMAQSMTALDITYDKGSQSAVQTDFTTKSGYRDFYFDSLDRKTKGESYFKLDREPTADEKITGKAVGLNADQVEIKNIHVVSDADGWYLNFSMSFKKIDGLGIRHLAKFNLEFTVEYEAIQRITTKTFNDFTLTFEPIEGTPYAVVMESTYTFKNTTKNISFDIQVECDPEYKPVGQEISRFRKGHYMIGKNLTRETTYDDSPIFFTTPQEPGVYESTSSDQEFAAGDDSNVANISLLLKHNGNQKKTFTTNFEFDFYDAPSTDESHIINKYPDASQGQEPLTVNFIYEGQPSVNYTDDEWAQSRSIGIVQSATNSKNNETETRLGTAWAFSEKGSWNQTNFATTYDVRRDAMVLSQSPYTDYKFGFVFYNDVKPWVHNDSKKYVVIDDDIERNIYYIPTDYQEFFQWYDVESGDLSWTIGGDVIGPDIAIFRVNMENSSPVGDIASQTKIYERSVKSFTQALDSSWHTLVPPLISSMYNGFKPSDSGGGEFGEMRPFNKKLYSYGYTGGFSSTKIEINEKEVPALYWKSFKMNVGGDDLDLLGTFGYSLGCSRDWEILGTNGSGQKIHHECPAFVMMNNSFYKRDYFDDAGRGALFFLRPKNPEVEGGLFVPQISGINWNGGSNFNWSSTFTPYFDCFVYDKKTSTYDTPDRRNLLYDWEHP